MRQEIGNRTYVIAHQYTLFYISWKLNNDEFPY